MVGISRGGIECSRPCVNAGSPSWVTKDHKKFLDWCGKKNNFSFGWLCCNLSICCTKNIRLTGCTPIWSKVLHGSNDCPDCSNHWRKKEDGRKSNSSMKLFGYHISYNRSWWQLNVWSFEFMSFAQLLSVLSLHGMWCASGYNYLNMQALALAINFAFHHLGARKFVAW